MLTVMFINVTNTREM